MLLGRQRPASADSGDRRQGHPPLHVTVETMFNNSSAQRSCLAAVPAARAGTEQHRLAAATGRRGLVARRLE